MTSNPEQPLVIAPDALFFLAKDGETFGPYTVEEVWSLLAAQQILPAHLVWTDGMEAWDEIGALFDVEALLGRATQSLEPDTAALKSETSEPAYPDRVLDEMEIPPTRRGTLFARLGVASTAAIFLHLGLLLSVTLGASYIFPEATEEPVVLATPEPSIDVSLVTVDDPPPPPPVVETPAAPPPDPPPPPAVPDLPLPTPPAPAPVVTAPPPPVPPPPVPPPPVPPLPAPDPLPPPVEPAQPPPEQPKPVVHHAPPSPVPAPAPAVVDASPSDYLDSPAPRYPYDARRMRQEGTVVLRVSVDDSGSPMGVSVEQSSGYPLLDQAAQKQVADYFRFRVGSARILRVPIAFQL